uniref:Uncharacterized protein n=1 Tax=Lepeophtheirus salmonis TaxID=72036 RepID=A0A0K2T4Q0_LEPSM
MFAANMPCVVIIIFKVNIYLCNKVLLEVSLGKRMELLGSEFLGVRVTHMRLLELHCLFNLLLSSSLSFLYLTK